ncbi:MAG: glycosyltransferase [Thiobacillaceae bacterium]|nr:glycosyltransferase [Thiobacillaceae bacterium]
MRAPEHIIIINDVAHVNGGAAKVCIEEAKALAIRGLQVTFFAPCGPVDDDLRAAGVEVICLDQRDVIDEPHRLRALTRGLWNATAARALAAVVTKADRRRTLLHAHSFSRALSPAFGPVFTRSGLAHVYTMHEYFLACPNGGFFIILSNASATDVP